MIATNGFRRAVLSVAAVLAAARGAAQDLPSHVKVYGFLNAEVERVQATGAESSYEPRGRVSDGNSRVGVSGTIELGARTKALWQLEGSLNAFDQSGTSDKGLTASIVSRNSFVGVQDERFGTLVAGNVDSAYRSLVGSGGELGGNLGFTAFGLDLWNNTSAQLSGNPDAVFSRGEARYRSSVHYLTPEGIVRAAASYQFDEAGAPNLRRERAAVAARLKLAGFQLGAGLDWQGDTGVDADVLATGTGFRTTGVDGVVTYFSKAVASYTLPTGTYVGAGVERASYGYAKTIPPTASNPYTVLEKGRMTQTGAMASVGQAVGPLALMASWGKLWKLDGAPFARGAAYEARQLSLGARYAFGERFAVYGYYTRIENASAQSVNLGQAPVYTIGAGTADAYLSPGNSPRAYGFGAIARF